MYPSISSFGGTNAFQKSRSDCVKAKIKAPIKRHVQQLHAVNLTLTKKAAKGA
jgi:hypothetical protein